MNVFIVWFHVTKQIIFPLKLSNYVHSKVQYQFDKSELVLSIERYSPAMTQFFNGSGSALRLLYLHMTRLDAQFPSFSHIRYVYVHVSSSSMNPAAVLLLGCRLVVSRRVYVDDGRVVCVHTLS